MIDGYNGSTSQGAPGTPNGFCGTPDAPQWIGFQTAGDTVQFTITPSVCQQSEGIEAAIYTDCSSMPLACLSAAGAAPLTIAAETQPNTVYFLVIDGINGDVCNFRIDVDIPGMLLTDVPPASPFPLQGPFVVSAGDTATYSITPPSNYAIAYEWTAPAGALVNGQSPPVLLPASGGTHAVVTFGSGSGKVGVRAVNACAASPEMGKDVSVGFNLEPPCPSNLTSASDFCNNLCVFCDFTNYSGSTVGYTPDTAPGFCGTIENNQWLGFVASSSAVTLTLTGSNCESGDGLQMALYNQCDLNPIYCADGCIDCADIPIVMNATLTPGKSYFVMIDGFAGDVCDFTLSVSPQIPTPILGTPGPIQGPAATCAGATVTYQIPPVPGAGAYVWTATPGSSINGMPPPVALAANQVAITFPPTGGAVQICVQPVNSCSAGLQVCRTVTVAAIPPTILPPLTICAEDAPYVFGDIFVETSGYYCVTYSSYLGCDSTVCRQITVLPPIVRVLPSQFICPGDSVVVCGQAYYDAGGYSAVCESYQGCDSTINFSVQVTNPVADIQGASILNCLTTSIMLNAAPSLGVKTWRDAGGQVLGTGNTLTVNQPGTYFLETVVTPPSSSGCSATDSIVILADTTPPNAWAQDDTLGCTEPCVTLQGGSDTPGAIWTWIGPPIQDPLNPQVCQPGVYTLLVTNTMNGCTAMATATVYESPVLPPQVTIVGGGTLTCFQPSLTLSCSAPDSNYVIAWTGPGGFTASGCTITVPVLLPGVYTMTATDPETGCQTVQSTAIDVDADMPEVTATGGTITCGNPLIQIFGNSATPGVIYTWYSQAFPINEQNPFVSVQGQYILVVTAPNGCTNSVTVQVDADTEPPAVTGQVVNDSGAQGIGAIDIDISGGSPPYSVQWWKDGQPFSNEEDLSGLFAGNYTAVVQGDNDCSDTLTVVVDNLVSTNPGKELLSGWTVFPNPATDYLVLQAPDVSPKQVNIRLMDMTGRVVLEQHSVVSGSIRLDVQRLPAGVYQLRVLEEGRTGALNISVKR